MLEPKDDEYDLVAQFFGVDDLRKDRMKARDEGGRISLDLGENHFMFDGLELDEDQAWCLD